MQPSSPLARHHDPPSKSLVLPIGVTTVMIHRHAAFITISPPSRSTQHGPRLCLQERCQRQSRSRPELLLAARSSKLELLLINAALPRRHAEQIEAALDQRRAEQIEAVLDRCCAVDRGVSPHLRRGFQPSKIGAPASRPHRRASSMGGTTEG
jgi:hypothetical protein